MISGQKEAILASVRTALRRQGIPTEDFSDAQLMTGLGLVAHVVRLMGNQMLVASADLERYHLLLQDLADEDTTDDSQS